MNEQEIKNRISQKIEDIDYINVVNFSESHAGHEGASKNSHFHVTLASDYFLGKTRIQRHKAVLSLFKEELLANKIHALSLTICTKKEFDKVRNNNVEEDTVK
ncbi:BolA family transcriptional regulator [Anaplasmataceae bacterium AB001_6]|nr:BolA family transcriptional regulator [Anaplasmataceae bacterium AB001_6]